MNFRRYKLELALHPYEIFHRHSSIHHQAVTLLGEPG